MLPRTVFDSRVNELGNTGDKRPPHSSTAQEMSCVSDLDWTLHLKKKKLDPITRSPAAKSAAGIIKICVDDLFRASGNDMEQRFLTKLRKYFQVGSADWNDATFSRQGIRWASRPYIEVSQEKAYEELDEIPVERDETKEDLHCTPTIQTKYRSILGQNNWLQSSTQSPQQAGKTAQFTASETSVLAIFTEDHDSTFHRIS